MKVVFSERAYTALLSETYEKITTETGGIFLGYYESDTWYVVEAIDPGPKSIFEVAYFEYDQKYVTHLINKIARMYRKDLSLLGLWHRHPGSFDVFSSTDDGTNMSYAKLNKVGAISALVNIDPKFRLTVYHVSLPMGRVKYTPIHYEVGDSLFPSGVLELLSGKELEDKINASGSLNGDDYGHSTYASQYRFKDVLELLSQNNAPVRLEKKYQEEIKNASKEPDFVDCLSDAIADDIDYLVNVLGIELIIRHTAYYLFISAKGEDKDVALYFSHIKSTSQTVYIYNGYPYVYTPGMIESIVAGNTESKEKRNGLFDTIKNVFKMSRKGNDND